MPVRPIYLDHSATTPLDGVVLEAMMPYLRENFGNPNSIHAWGRRARQAVEEARGAPPDHLGHRAPRRPGRLFLARQAGL